MSISIRSNSFLHGIFEKSKPGLEFHFDQKDRSEIKSGLNIFRVHFGHSHVNADSDTTIDRSDVNSPLM